MKILFISTEAWSDKSPEGIVVRKLLCGFIENGVTVDVLTTRSTEVPGINFEYVIEDKSTNIFSAIMKRVTGIEKRSFVHTAISNLSSYNINSYNAVITRSEPFFVHEIGYHIKKKYPSIKWIASFGDPVFINPYNSKSPIKKVIAKKNEKKYWKTCDLVTHTNRSVIEEYIKNEFEKDKCCVLENPFVSIEKDSTNSRAIHNQISFAYIGSLYGKRKVDPIIEYLSSVNFDFKLDIIGGVRNIYYENRFGFITKFFYWRDKRKITSPIGRYKLHDKVNLLPFMEKKDLDEYIHKNIDVLINIDAKIGNKNLFLSSKIVEYLQYKKPILNFSIQGATVDFMKNVGVDYFVDLNNQKNEIIERDRLSQLIPCKNIDNYTSQQVTKRLLEKIKSL